jgi:hypothetical protein
VDDEGTSTGDVVNVQTVIDISWLAAFVLVVLVNLQVTGRVEDCPGSGCGDYNGTINVLPQ